jgi:hypothetical protein
MTSAAPAPAFDPSRIEQIRAANDASKQHVGQRGFCGDCDFLLAVLDSLLPPR